MVELSLHRGIDAAPDRPRDHDRPADPRRTREPDRIGSDSADFGVLPASGDELYAALFLGALIKPVELTTKWLVTPDGPPPVDLRLIASALVKCAEQLTKIDEAQGRVGRRDR